MNCGKFIGELIRARDITHIEHLQAKHWGGHMALNEIYEALEGHIDTVAELRLARGPLEIEVNNIPSSICVESYLEGELIPTVDAAKEMMDKKGYNDISAEIDMIKTTVMKGLYKIKNLTGKHKEEHKGKHKEEKEDSIYEDDMMQGGLLYSKKKCGGKAKCGGGKLKKIIKK